MPVEFRLELMPVVGANSVDAERELFDHEVHKVNRVGLVVPLVDLQRTNAGCIATAVY
jgi:hypothetical protein